MNKKITETDGVHEQWYIEAKEQTLKTLPEFIRHLTEDYVHDYGTICHALASGAVATTCAMNRTPQGNITGFQASAVMWEYMAHWANVTPPLKLIDYKNMLFPQYEHEFEKTISKETWQFLQEEARKILDNNQCCVATVETHLRNIVAGKIPFGYTLKE